MSQKISACDEKTKESKIFKNIIHAGNTVSVFKKLTICEVIKQNQGKFIFIFHLIIIIIIATRHISTLKERSRHAT